MKMNSANAIIRVDVLILGVRGRKLVRHVDTCWTYRIG